MPIVKFSNGTELEMDEKSIPFVFKELDQIASIKRLDTASYSDVIPLLKNEVRHIVDQLPLDSLKSLLREAVWLGHGVSMYNRQLLAILDQHKNVIPVWANYRRRKYQ